MLVTAAFDQAEGRYGCRWVHVLLARWGEACSPELVRHLMRQLGLVACQPRRSRKGTTRQAARWAQVPDLVNRDLTAQAPGATMVGDITCVRTWEGWPYLALVIDCCSRKIIGWAMADSYKTPLIQRAVRVAAANVELPCGAVFHSDRGSSYTSEEFAATLTDLGVRQSVGRTGTCYDSSLSESTSGVVKSSSSTVRSTRPGPMR